VAILAHVVPLAVAAREVVLEEDEVALRESLVLLELAAHLREVAHVFVAHDERRAAQRQLVLADVGAADAGHLHLQ
jgi:hypothetical protein